MREYKTLTARLSAELEEARGHSAALEESFKAALAQHHDAWAAERERLALRHAEEIARLRECVCIKAARVLVNRNGYTPRLGEPPNCPFFVAGLRERRVCERRYLCATLSCVWQLARAAAGSRAPPCGTRTRLSPRRTCDNPDPDHVAAMVCALRSCSVPCLLWSLVVFR